MVKDYMYQVELFLGFPLEASLLKKIQNLNPEFYALFVSDYLEEGEWEGARFLGKSLGKIIEKESLELSKENLYSILKKMIPDFPFDKESFILFPRKIKSEK